VILLVGVAQRDAAALQQGRAGLLFVASLKRSNPATATADKNGRLWMIRIAPNNADQGTFQKCI